MKAIDKDGLAIGKGTWLKRNHTTVVVVTLIFVLLTLTWFAYGITKEIWIVILKNIFPVLSFFTASLTLLFITGGIKNPKVLISHPEVAEIYLNGVKRLTLDCFLAFVNTGSGVGYIVSNKAMLLSIKDLAEIAVFKSTSYADSGASKPFNRISLKESETPIERVLEFTRTDAGGNLKPGSYVLKLYYDVETRFLYMRNRETYFFTCHTTLLESDVTKLYNARKSAAEKVHVDLIEIK